MITSIKALIMSNKQVGDTTRDTKLVVLPGGRGPLFEVAAGHQRPSRRTEFSAKGRVPTRLAAGPEARALSQTQPASNGQKIARKKMGGAAGALRSARPIPTPNMADTPEKQKLRALRADKRQCPQCRITSDCSTRTDCTEPGCPDFKLWEKKEARAAGDAARDIEAATESEVAA